MKYAGQQAKELLKEKHLAHVIYGIRDQITDWKNEMYRFRDDKSFDEFINELYEKYGDIYVYAVHA